MRKLALNDEILLKVENPARYIGNEVNSVMKDKNVMYDSAWPFRILTRSACPILGSRYYMTCSISVKIPGVNVFILRGRIWTRL